MTIYKKLMEIQSKLKVSKNQFNNFGKYKYRSCEDILEGLKPLLKENGCVLIINDDVKLVNERYYIESTVNLIDAETGEKVDTKALAREEDSKKGMDSSQVTGATSSYARKYALNAMFAIDDTKDSDATNEHDTKTEVEDDFVAYFDKLTPEQKEYFGKMFPGKYGSQKNAKFFTHEQREKIKTIVETAKNKVK